MPKVEMEDEEEDPPMLIGISRVKPETSVSQMKVSQPALPQIPSLETSKFSLEITFRKSRRGSMKALTAENKGRQPVTKKTTRGFQDSK